MHILRYLSFSRPILSAYSYIKGRMGYYYTHLGVAATRHLYSQSCSSCDSQPELIALVWQCANWASTLDSTLYLVRVLDFSSHTSAGVDKFFVL